MQLTPEELRRITIDRALAALGYPEIEISGQRVGDDGQPIGKTILATMPARELLDGEEGNYLLIKGENVRGWNIYMKPVESELIFLLSHFGRVKTPSFSWQL